MSEHFQESYRVLGIAPGASWHELKAAYRAKISASHPDRIQGDAAAKKRAEDQTKAINRAYQQLTKYFRKHGVLPVSSSPQATAPSQADPLREYVPFTEPIAEHVSVTHKSIGTWSAVAIACVGALGYFLFGSQSNNSTELHPSTAAPGADTNPALKEPIANQRLFAHGSTIGEVYSIQGVPTNTANDVWYYGTSKVYFSNGVVVHWEQTPEHPLKASTAATRGPALPESTFGMGSTKSEVRRLQGDPIRESDKVWEYGVSRIYFEQDRVVKWYESPLDPLKIKR